MLRACVAIAVCTAWVGCSPAAFFSGGRDGPQVHVIFNEPGYEGGKKRIHNELIDLFARAEPDSHIYFPWNSGGRRSRHLSATHRTPIDAAIHLKE